MYDVKLLDYGNELQINWYEYAIGTREEKVKNETNKWNFETCKQSDISDKQFDTSVNEIDNKVRSTRRTKQSIYNISRANTWDYFATFTFKEDRYNYDLCKARLTKYLNNLRSRKCEDLEYLAVPEEHKDGAYHFHALLKGVNNDVLCASYEKGRLMFKNWNYGISQLESVKDTGKVAMYITKYITKDFVDGVKNKRRYFCSIGVKRAEEKTIYRGDMSMLEFFENHYSDYDITHQKKCVKGGYSVNYIQLKKKSHN
ncbi:MAG: hypothetical protein E7258_04790 [Lachnospiraceae bacterium]|nr:hypothetical protein [Lachnospiraceae bacterium]